MTLVLGIETATDVGSVAVGDETGVVAEVVVGPRRHAELLTWGVGKCLEAAGASVGDLGAVVVADGPGSFTGLRIGFATAWGVIRDHDLPAYVAPSLMGCARGAWSQNDRVVVPAYDALRGDVFAAAYTFTEDGYEEIIAPTLVDPAEAIERIGPIPAVFVGAGWRSSRGLTLPGAGLDPMPLSDVLPRASALLQVHLQHGGTRVVDDPSGFEPDYGRLAEAQARWERTHGRPLNSAD